MATRMQQRRGTAAQWTAANPTLAAGEIGFETDTSKFKMGNGSSAWSALQYFANAAELAAIIDGAPELLNTLNELAAALGDDPDYLLNLSVTVDEHVLDTTNIHGVADMTQLTTHAEVTAEIAVHSAETTNVHGIADTAALATGISEALVNTLVGILSSALAIIFYNFFSNRVDQITYSMDEAGFSIIQEFQTSGK